MCSEVSSLHDFLFEDVVDDRDVMLSLDIIDLCALFEGERGINGVVAIGVLGQMFSLSEL